MIFLISYSTCFFGQIIKRREIFQVLERFLLRYLICQCRGFGDRCPNIFQGLLPVIELRPDTRPLPVCVGILAIEVYRLVAQGQRPSRFSQVE